MNKKKGGKTCEDVFANPFFYNLVFENQSSESTVDTHVVLVLGM